MIQTSVLAPVPGHALSLAEVPGERKLLKLLPHAYVIMTAEGVGVLVHLGLDTVQLQGSGFTAHVAQGDTVTAGQRVITYDVPAIVAAGFSPVVPVVVMDEREPGNVAVADEVTGAGPIGCGATLFTATK